LFISFIAAGCSVSKNPLREEFRKLQHGIIVDDTSYIYALPFEAGKAYWMVQGYFSRFSHKERAALDFKMRRGSKICAAREGVVVRVKEDGERGGLNKKYRADGNNIVIQHADGSRAGYWHLQKDGALVNVGDTVQRGQVIGLSGKTGYAAFPHLHFLVWDFDKDGKWQQVPTRFETNKGTRYLKSIKRYKNPSPAPNK
ncbi:MAG: M23 family metallopeptidase, partial [Chitinophagaceae bacterium]|nr:M23 family metallopeptidase [Chitinophagaceae bacterium]